MRSVGALLLVVAACSRTDASSNTDPNSVKNASVAIATPSASTSVVQIDASSIAPLTVPCRLIVVTGDARDGSDAGLHGLEEAPEDFITLGPAASMTAKDGKTSREVTFKGPAHARVCVSGDEEEWLADGEFSSVPGAGETPGAEVWVITLHGAIRYGTGYTHVTASHETTSVRAQQGAAIYPAPGPVSVRTLSATGSASDGGMPVVDGEGWMHLTTDATLELAGPVDAKVLLDVCTKQATIARDLASAMLHGDAGNLGTAASQHVIERRRARALCGMASLAAQTSAKVLQANVAAAASGDRLWREVPQL